MGTRDVGFLTDSGRCECGKVRWLTRADAKRFAKRHHQGEHVRAYQCGDFWHLGHIDKRVLRGTGGRA